MKNNHFLLISFALFLSTNVISQPGSLDTSFSHDGKSTIAFDGLNYEYANAVAIRSDGRIYVAGQTYNGTYYNFAIAQYGPKGLLNGNFGTSGKVVTAVGNYNNYASAVALQTDNKIVCAGRAGNGTYFNVAVVRYNTDGTLDNTFSGTGKVITPVTAFNSVANAIAIQPDGKIVVAGYAGNGSFYDVAIVRYNTNGTLDNTFNGTGFVVTSLGSRSDIINALVIQTDGKIVVAGKTDINSTQWQSFVARYKANGKLDPNFGTGGITYIDFLNDHGSQLHAIALQADGKIVAGGDADNSTQDTHVFCLVRLNKNGTFDNTFHNGGIRVTASGIYDIGYGLAIQSDGKIVQAGSYESFSGIEYDEEVIRYNTDGSIDLGFGNNGYVFTNYAADFLDENAASAVAIQPDGKIVTVGSVDLEGNNKLQFSTTRYIGGSSTIAAQTQDDALNKTSLARIYPNPVTNILRITGIDDKSSATLAIIDVSGNTLKRMEVNSRDYTWNVNDLPRGNYILTITQNGKVNSIKFIKE